MKPVHVYCPVFRRDVYVFFKWTQEKFERYMKDNYQVTFDDLDKYNGGVRVIQNEHKHSIILLWVRKSNPIEELSNLSHESVHASNAILSDAGVKIDTDNDELQAYHSSMIFRETLKGVACSK